MLKTWVRFSHPRDPFHLSQRMRIPSVPLKRDSHSDSAAQPKNSRSSKSRGRRRRRSQRTFIVLVCHHSNVSKTLNRHFLANKISDVWPSIVVAKLLFAYFVKLPKPQTTRVKYHMMISPGGSLLDLNGLSELTDVIFHIFLFRFIPRNSQDWTTPSGPL